MVSSVSRPFTVSKPIPIPVPKSQSSPLIEVPAHLIKVLKQICANSPLLFNNPHPHESAQLAPILENPFFHFNKCDIQWDPTLQTVFGALAHDFGRIAFSTNLTTSFSPLGSIRGVTIHPSAASNSPQNLTLEMRAEFIIHEWLNSSVQKRSTQVVKDALMALK